ncbi:MAG: HAD family hydrolase [Burkholderiaceae bacterium]|jgi:3-deoxy-D-manno-octulosonate 8-phosphate phosphatase (KDO 8-P phosphatase)|nr:HAD family hydrolase [Burkholderiaceae bacterium]MEB2318968.1 HAD family hydrolase [Pseudomonadota bacterium]
MSRTQLPQARTDVEDVTLRARRIAVVAFDVDGTLTDGRIHIGPAGEAMKSFYVRDGLGISLLRRAGLHCALVTARESAIVERRAAELGIDEVMQGVARKGEALARLAQRAGVTVERIAYMGDDWPDIPALRRAGLAAAPAGAPPEILERVHWISRRPAGAGAVREFAEFILRAQGRWQELLDAQERQ